MLLGCPNPILCSIINSFPLLSHSIRQVLYVLLTSPPCLYIASYTPTSDLHVLSILSAFILSQDQTLHSISFYLFFSVSFFLLTPCLLLQVLSYLPSHRPQFSRTNIYYHIYFYLVNYFFLFFAIFFLLCNSSLILSN